MSGTATARGGAAIAVLRLLGAALLLAIAGIHLYLWSRGYAGIDVIGPGFLAQTVLGVGGALLLLVSPPRLLTAATVLCALFAAGSLAALLWSTFAPGGLFGFVESTAATLWWETLWVEVAAVVVLTALAVLAVRRPR